MDVPGLTVARAGHTAVSPLGSLLALHMTPTASVSTAKLQVCEAVRELIALC